MKRITILGSTGHIGRATLEVIDNLRKDFKVVGLSANSRIRVLIEQVKKFHPKRIAVVNPNSIKKLKRALKEEKVSLLSGKDGLNQLAQNSDTDILVLAISGSEALFPLLKAIDSGKTVALANKEALVMAGPLIMQKLKTKKAKILPVDSEQVAIWQCIDGKDKKTIKKIYLTASGGPLKDIDKSAFKDISLKEVLDHPCWKMGKKITVDSATLMNKGLELFETMYLFDIDVSKIEVLIHPEAVIHSMVEFIDGSILAQLSYTDMRIPIQYALTYPERKEGFLPTVDFIKLKHLSFYKPDLNKFPTLALAYEVARKGGTLPAVLNSANEVAVEAFLKGEINFLSIFKIIKKVVEQHRNVICPDLEGVLSAHRWAKIKAQQLVEGYKK